MLSRTPFPLPWGYTSPRLHYYNFISQTGWWSRLSNNTSFSKKARSRLGPASVLLLAKPQYLHASGGPASVPPLAKPQYLHASGGPASVPPFAKPQYLHASGGHASVPPLAKPQYLHELLQQLVWAGRAQCAHAVENGQVPLNPSNIK